MDIMSVLNHLAQNPNQPIEIQTNLESEDNEIIVQVLLTTIRDFVANPVVQNTLTNPEDLFKVINMVLVRLGFMADYNIISPLELKTIVYYSKLTSQGELLRSPYHPIHLRSIMSDKGLNVPQSFDLLYKDIDYLPNICNVWEHGEDLVIIYFTKVIITNQSDAEEINAIVESFDQNLHT